MLTRLIVIISLILSIFPLLSGHFRLCSLIFAFLLLSLTLSLYIYVSNVCFQTCPSVATFPRPRSGCRTRFSPVWERLRCRWLIWCSTSTIFSVLWVFSPFLINYLFFRRRRSRNFTLLRSPSRRMTKIRQKASWLKSVLLTLRRFWRDTG